MLHDRGLRSLAAMGVAALLCSAAPSLAQTSLGTAASFGVLAGSTVTNTGASVVAGNVGVSPGTAVIGFPPGIVTPPATIHSADAVAAQAQVDLTTAYNAIAGTPTLVDLTGQDLGGLTLVPGVFGFTSSAQLTGTLTLDALGNPNAVFIFKIGSTLTTATGSSVLVINGGSSCNVFWQVGSSATLGTTTTFAGNTLALTSITLNTGASVSGRALARNGAVTLAGNSVTACAPPPGPVGSSRHHAEPGDPSERRHRDGLRADRLRLRRHRAVHVLRLPRSAASRPVAQWRNRGSHGNALGDRSSDLRHHGLGRERLPGFEGVRDGERRGRRDLDPHALRLGPDRPRGAHGTRLDVPAEEDRLKRAPSPGA